MNNPTTAHFAEYFRYEGLKMSNVPVAGLIHKQSRQFRENFGINWIQCAIAWEMINPNLLHQYGKSPKKQHLLWCLLFFKRYSKNQMDAKTAGATYKTFSKWVWIVAAALADCESELVSTT